MDVRWACTRRAAVRGSGNLAAGCCGGREARTAQWHMLLLMLTGCPRQLPAYLEHLKLRGGSRIRGGISSGPGRDDERLACEQDSGQQAQRASSRSSHCLLPSRTEQVVLVQQRQCDATLHSFLPF